DPGRERVETEPERGERHERDRDRQLSVSNDVSKHACTPGPRPCRLRMRFLEMSPRNLDAVSGHQGDIGTLPLTDPDQVDVDDSRLPLLKPSDPPVTRGREVRESSCEDARTERGGCHLQGVSTDVFHFS